MDKKQLAATDKLCDIIENGEVTCAIVQKGKSSLSFSINKRIMVYVSFYSKDRFLDTRLEIKAQDIFDYPLDSCNGWALSFYDQDRIYKSAFKRLVNRKNEGVEALANDILNE